MQKITPWILSYANGEEAVNFYNKVFEDSKIGEIKRFPDSIPGIEPGSVLTASINIFGTDLYFLNGGPDVKPNPSISFFVNAQTEEEIDKWWGKLMDGGKALMELQKYPFSEKYGWAEDKYGVSWQLSLTKEKSKMVPLLMFTHENFGKAEEAMNFYASLFQNSSIGVISRYGKESGDQEGKINYAEFVLEGIDFKTMESNFDHKFDFNEAVSFSVECVDQKEVDHLWNGLIADGGEESQCGWLKDKYGVSWQIVPKALNELTNDPDPERAKRAIQAMLGMRKIVISQLEEAANQA